MERFSNRRIMIFSCFAIDGITYKSMYYEWKGDLYSGLWEAEPITTLNTARYGHACFSTGDVILVAGGWKSAYNINPHMAWEIRGWLMI